MSIERLISNLDSCDVDHMVSKPRKFMFTDYKYDTLIVFDNLYGRLNRFNHESFKFAGHKILALEDGIYLFSQQPLALSVYRNM